MRSSVSLQFAEVFFPELQRAALAACVALAGRSREKLLHHGMGLAMRELLGVADPSDVRARLERALGDVPEGAAR